MLSTRQDLLSVEMAQELALLQDKVPPFSGSQAQAIIEQALELQSINELFVEFESTALASASIAQVHSAKLLKDDGSTDETKQLVGNAELANNKIITRGKISFNKENTLFDFMKNKINKIIEK